MTGHGSMLQRAPDDAWPARYPEDDYAPAAVVDDASLRDLFAAVLRRRLAVLLTYAAVLGAAAAFLITATPHYRAEAQLLIEPQQAATAGVTAVAAGVDADQEAVRSESYVLSSSALVGNVVADLGLRDDPEFNRALRPPGLLQRLLPANSGTRDAEDTATVASRVIEAFRSRLSVAPVEDARVISVRFESQNPARAQSIANAIAGEYLAMRQSAKQSSTREVSGWLDRQIDELRAKVESGEAAIEALRQRYGLVDGGRGNLEAQELAEVNSQLVAVRATRAEAEARLAKIRRLLEVPGGVQSASEVLNSALIRGLREQESRLETQIAELHSELGPKHPRMQQLRAEESELQQKIDSEIGKIVAGLQNEVDVARAREQSLQRSLAMIKQRVADANESAVEVRALQREVDANRALLTNLLGQQKQTQPQSDAGFLQADARIISPATLPVNPAFPDRTLVFGLALVAGTVLAGLLVLVLEMLDGGFRSPEQLEAQTSAHALGFIPLSRFRKQGGELRHLQEKPASAFAEATRTLLWSVRLEFGEPDSKVILLTSAQPGEGKTTIASSLACTQGRAGKRVLLVDADLRRPSVHTRLGHERAPGLVDFLAGQCSLGQVQRPHATLPGVWVIGAGDPDIDVQNLIAGERMRQLLRRARERFDLVIVDSPPVIVGADARLLSRLVDATVLVVRWGRTPRQAVRLALRRLHAAGAARVGAVLSQVDAKKYARYSYGDSGAYSGDMAKYYAGG